MKVTLKGPVCVQLTLIKSRALSQEQQMALKLVMVLELLSTLAPLRLGSFSLQDLTPKEILLCTIKAYQELMQMLQSHNTKTNML